MKIISNLMFLMCLKEKVMLKKSSTYTCQPASMALIPTPETSPRIKIWDELNSSSCWTSGFHAFMVALAPRYLPPST